MTSAAELEAKFRDILKKHDVSFVEPSQEKDGEKKK